MYVTIPRDRAEYGLQPYWNKIAMLRQRMDVAPAHAFFVWIDDDIVMTNHAHDNFARALALHPAAALIVTEDASG